MKRISLNESQFKALVLDGSVEVEETLIVLGPIDLLQLISGGIVELPNILLILNDIGYDRIHNILRLKNFKK